MLARAQEFLSQRGRPCVYFESTRAADLPLQRSGLGRLLKRPIAAPRLPLLQSKFGGTPYVTANDGPAMKDRRFLLQINLAEVTNLPEPFPSRGLFSVDMVPPKLTNRRWFAIRFDPDPAEGRAVALPEPVACIGNYEASLRFLPGLSYEPSEWEAVFANQDDDALKDAWSDCEYELNTVIGAVPTDVGEERHRLGGHRTSVLNEDEDLPVPPGYSKDPRDYELLLWITYDNTADFGWGSNVAYVLIHRDDLAAGRLERAFDAPQNY